jgi:uroporphyrinogen-III synthase
MANVILLRASSQEATDLYEVSFRNLGYNPSSVPVLETAFTNSDDLRRTIANGPKTEEFAGVVITSARACDAWAQAVKDLLQIPLDPLTGESVCHVHLGFASIRDIFVVTWSSTPFYVVGEATSKAVSAIGETHGQGPFAPKDIRGGVQTGTSERLAHFILDDLPEREGKKLLYLTGDKNRDTLPKILTKGRVNLESLRVYETRGSSTFARDLEQVINSTPAGKLESSAIGI